MRLPLGLLLLIVAAMAAAVVWATFAVPPETAISASGAGVDLALPSRKDVERTVSPTQGAPAATSRGAPDAVTAPNPGAPPSTMSSGATVEPPPLPPMLAAPKLNLQVAALGPPLPAAPDEALLSRTDVGPLPVVGRDGRKPWRAYARPFDAADARPRVAIVVAGLGLSSVVTEAAIQALPSGVTLAFAPYSAKLGDWIRSAREAGHEVLLNLPMEPLDFPIVDPGPKALLTSLTIEENQERLLWTLSRGVGYVGVADFMGSRFTMSREHLKPVLEALNARGLLYVDSRSAPRSLSPGLAAEVGLPATIASEAIDEPASRDAIDARLAALERAARNDGRAVGIGSPYPVTIERLAAWLNGIEARGLVLAPVSAVVGARRP